MTPAQARAMLHNGGSIRVDLPGGTVARVEIENATYVARVLEGWAAGVVEPICSTSSDYFERRYLANALRVSPWRYVTLNEREV